jgi:hypothetical protein
LTIPAICVAADFLWTSGNNLINTWNSSSQPPGDSTGGNPPANPSSSSPNGPTTGGAGGKPPVNPPVSAPGGFDPPPGQWDSANYPLPPGHNSNWTWGPASGEAEAGWRWWDPNGGEWRWHASDRWHPTGHWDYNPWTQWNSPWQNVPVPPPAPPPATP